VSLCVRVRVSCATHVRLRTCVVVWVVCTGVSGCGLTTRAAAGNDPHTWTCCIESVNTGMVMSYPCPHSTSCAVRCDTFYVQLWSAQGRINSGHVGLGSAGAVPLDSHARAGRCASVLTNVCTHARMRSRSRTHARTVAEGRLSRPRRQAVKRRRSTVRAGPRVMMLDAAWTKTTA
jgi:hypothetical protein